MQHDAEHAQGVRVLRLFADYRLEMLDRACVLEQSVVQRAELKTNFGARCAGAERCRVGLHGCSQLTAVLQRTSEGEAGACIRGIGLHERVARCDRALELSIRFGSLRGAF
jgi:hypothetical protein